MKHIKSKNQYIKESYFGDMKDKFQDAKDDAMVKMNKTISDKATGFLAKKTAKSAAKLGGFPKSEMEKFITYIKSSCAGEVITIERIKELVQPMLRFGMGLSHDRARNTAIPTDNIDFVSLISELIYDEMSERGELDCSDVVSDYDDDDFDYENEDEDEDEDEMRNESKKHRFLKAKAKAKQRIHKR